MSSQRQILDWTTHTSAEGMKNDQLVFYTKKLIVLTTDVNPIY